VVTVRVRVCEPVPQVLEQEVKAPQAETTQWIGQGPALQAMLPLRAPQTTPPLAGAVTTLRERVLTPSPQVFEQALQPAQAEVTQSTGQELVLQPMDWVVAPQASPPWLASR
jgi:hypothetical protein